MRILYIKFIKIRKLLHKMRINICSYSRHKNTTFLLKIKTFTKKSYQHFAYFEKSILQRHSNSVRMRCPHIAHNVRAAWLLVYLPCPSFCVILDAEFKILIIINRPFLCRCNVTVATTCSGITDYVYVACIQIVSLG